MDSAHVWKFLACVMYAAFFTLSSRASAATFTFINSCKYTVWPGILSNPGWPLLANGGFILESGQSTSLSVPAGWAGRFWGRTGCTFSSSGRGTCASGDCGGQYQCNGAGASPPATLAEFTLAGASSSKDFYDLSLVDGYNLPLAVIPRGGSGSCGIASCGSNLNLNCPGELQVVDDNQVVACKSACLAFSSAEYCCEGAYGNPSTCKPSLYSQLFKTACPTAYSYAYDDATSTFTCSGADYTITFCPSSSSERSVSNLQPGGGFSSSQMAFNSGPSIRALQSAGNAAVISSSLSLLSLCVLLFRYNL